MNSSAGSSQRDLGDVLTIGFGTAVSMWAIAYFSRLPDAHAPLLVLLGLMAAALFVGGIFAGRFGRHGVRTGAIAGLLTGLINLLVIGSLKGRGGAEFAPNALLMMGGSVIVSMLIGAIGAIVGVAQRRADAPTPYWPRHFATVTVGATLCLLAVGGAVTGAGAGLAVTDWPNTFGEFMFRYPAEKMTGGVYFEHAHRLFASLVGLTTLVFAIYIQMREPRGFIRTLAWIALLGVIVQGVLGGLRVTGVFTLSQSPEDTRPSLMLAIVHGVVAQLFLCTLVAIRVYLSTRPGEITIRRSYDGLSTDYWLSSTLVIVTLLQLIMGAAARHTGHGHALMAHMTFSAAVFLVALFVGMRVLMRYREFVPLRRISNHMLAILVLQLGLGFAAWVVRGGETASRGGMWQIIITTAHQTNGAILLANTLIIAMVLRRWLAPAVSVTAPVAAETR